MHSNMLLSAVAGVLLLAAPFTVQAAATPGTRRAELFDEVRGGFRYRGGVGCNPVWKR